jgi:hypothetical protein
MVLNKQVLLKSSFSNKLAVSMALSLAALLACRSDLSAAEPIPAGPVTPAAPAGLGTTVDTTGAGSEITTTPVTPVAPLEPTPTFVTSPRDIRPLPGGLDSVPMFNSNNPEIVLSEGILLSTFPSADGPAHLNYTFDGRFDLFAHHIADGKKSGHLEDLHLGLILGNTGEKPVTVKVLNAASYCSRPDAPFITMDALLDNDDGKIYAGPGDRVMDEILRNRKPQGWKTKVTVPPNKMVLLKSLPIHVKTLSSNLNGRSLFARLQSNGPVRMAIVSKFAPIEQGEVFREPTDDEFFAVLDAGKFVVPRDNPPTRPEDKGAIRYGRVAGVQSGSTWKTRVTDKGSSYLALPSPERAISYPISSLAAGTFGTGQIQSAPMVVRNDGTAYQAHGNYGVKYDLTFPLRNTSDRDLKLSVALETPVKSDEKKDTLSFITPTDKKVFYRGTIKIGSGSGKKISQTHYKHIVEHRGESVAPLIEKVIPKGDSCTVEVELLYPPDSTPPQMLTLSTSPDIE